MLFAYQATSQTLATFVTETQELRERYHSAERVRRVTERYNQELLKENGALERDKDGLKGEIDRLREEVLGLKGQRGCDGACKHEEDN